MGLTKKQKEVFEFIKEYYKSHQIAPTQKEIKEHFGLKSFGSVQRYLKYLKDAGLLDANWNAKRGLRLNDDNEVEEDTEIQVNHTPQEADLYTEELPLLGLVAAGNPIEALENPSETITIPRYMVSKPGRYFALTVRGDSMIEAGIHEDDILICRVQDHAKQGETIIAIVDGEATVKEYYRHTNHIELKPRNSTLSSIIVNSGEFRIAGTLAGLLRSY